MQTAVDAEHALIVAHIPANRVVSNQGEGASFDRTSFAYDEASDTLHCRLARV